MHNRVPDEIKELIEHLQNLIEEKYPKIEVTIELKIHNGHVVEEKTNLSSSDKQNSENQ